MRKTQLQSYLRSLVLLSLSAGCSDTKSTADMTGVDFGTADFTTTGGNCNADASTKDIVSDGGIAPDGGCYAACQPSAPPGNGVVDCHVTGADTANCTYEVLCLGRAHAAHRPCLDRNYLARAAELEAISVTAFRRLVRELRAHGAPAQLIARAERAAQDEIRHARAMRSLHRRATGKSARAHIPRQIGRVRPLIDIAIENAREGCVGETFGAFVAGVQAQTAGDPRARTTMATIACEEADHAAFSWDLKNWLDDRLSQRDRQRVTTAMRSAARVLRTRTVPQSEWLGMPTPAVAERALAELSATLWS